MLNEFKTFIARGNVLDLAVAVIIGAAFGTILTSFTENLLMPVLSLLIGGTDLTANFIVLGTVPPELAGSTDFEALKKAGVPLFGYGAFLTAMFNFLIIAFAIFLVVKAASKATKPADTPAAEPTTSEALLAEIRDELKAQPR